MYFFVISKELLKRNIFGSVPQDDFVGCSAAKFLFLGHDFFLFGRNLRLRFNSGYIAWNFDRLGRY